MSNKLSILLALVIMSIAVISACNKPANTEFVVEDSPYITTFKIDVDENGVIHYYREFVNDVLQYTTAYTFNDSIVTMVKKDFEGNRVLKQVFTLGENGYAVSSLDSSFSSTGNYYLNSEYEYDNQGFPLTTKIGWAYYGNTEDTGYYELYYSVEAGNIANLRIDIPDIGSTCTNMFGYTDIDNKLDVLNFSNGITGRPSSKLLSHKEENIGCTAGAYYTNPTSEYVYELNADGYIKKMSRKSTPSYQSTTAKKVYVTIIHTYYEYTLITP